MALQVGKFLTTNSEHLTGHDLIATRQEYMDISPKHEMESEQEIIQEKEMQFCQSF